MRHRDMDAATRFGFVDWLRAFDEELLKIHDVVSVEYDLSGFYSDIYQVIVLVKYDIGLNRDDYWDARSKLKQSVMIKANIFDLYKTGDRIEDMGQHFYFVFGCTEKWKKEHKNG